MSDSPVLVEMVRDDHVESAHRGSLVVLDWSGAVQISLGDTTTPIFPRSALKPAQAAALLEVGAPLSGEALAVAAGSHSGGPEHVALVESVLLKAGLDRDALQCPPDAPFGSNERQSWAESGAIRERIIMNCSGKHAGMLLACVTNGWPTETYLQPEHPLQIAIKKAIERLCGEEITFTTVDGCGAPLHMVSLLGLAKMALALAQAPQDSVLATVAAAMREHPQFVAGKGRDTALFIENIESFFTKEGAEAVQVGALVAKGSFAFKIEDGAMRARAPLVGEILKLWGVSASDLAPLAEVVEPVVLGGGVPRGRYRAVKIAN